MSAMEFGPDDFFYLDPYAVFDSYEEADRHARETVCDHAGHEDLDMGGGMVKCAVCLREDWRA